MGKKGKRRTSQMESGLKPIPNVWDKPLPAESVVPQDGSNHTPAAATNGSGNAEAVFGGVAPSVPLDGMSQASTGGVEASVSPGALSKTSAGGNYETFPAVSSPITFPSMMQMPQANAFNGGMMPFIHGNNYGMLPVRQPLLQQFYAPDVYELLKRQQRLAEVEMSLELTEKTYTYKWQALVKLENEAVAEEDKMRHRQEKENVENHYQPLLSKIHEELNCLYAIFPTQAIGQSQQLTTPSDMAVLELTTPSDLAVLQLTTPSDTAASSPSPRTENSDVDVRPKTQPKTTQHIPTQNKGQPIARQFSADFPSLGNQSPMSKKDVKKLQEQQKMAEAASSKVAPRNTPVTNHGRCRQRLTSVGSNASSRSSTPDPVPRNKPRVTIDLVNDIAAQQMKALVEKGDCVSLISVTDGILSQLGKKSVKELGIRDWNAVSCIKKMTFKQCKINAYIHAYKLTYGIGTLHELGQNLARLFDKTDFDELHLGPIEKQPELHVVFPVRDIEGNVTPITTTDILKSLREYMFRCNRSERMKLEDFLLYMKKKYRCDDLYKLGIRINSLGLAISVVSQARRDLNQSNDRTRVQYIQEMEELYEEKLRKIKETVSERMDDSKKRPGLTLGNQLRRKYCEMDSIDVIEDVFNTMDEIFVDCHIKTRLQHMLQFIKADQLARKMFQLALCKGKLEPPADLVRTDQRPAPSSHQAGHVDGSELPPRPREDAVLQELKSHLDKSKGIITLAILADIEHHLVSHFKFNHFHQMYNMTFMKFLSQRVKVLEECSSGVFTGKQTGLVVSKDELFQLIKQVGYHDNMNDEDFAKIDKAACKQFGVSCFRDLGHGPLSVALKQLQKVTIKPMNAVFYQAPLTTSQQTLADSGLLGSQTREKALCCLLKVPLLGNLVECSHWSLVFEPDLGNLKKFIEKHGGHLNVNGTNGTISDLYALQTPDGALLRVTKQTDEDKFAKAVDEQNANGVAGHLTSLVVEKGGVMKLPTKLLANHVTSGLKAQYSQMNKEEGDAADSKLALFVVDCLVKIPLTMCAGIARKILLEPFVSTLGSQKNACSILWDACTRNRREEHQLRMEALGLILSVQEWTTEMRAKLTPENEEIQDDFSEIQDLYEDDYGSEEEEYTSIEEQLTSIDDDCGFKLVSEPSGSENVSNINEIQAIESPQHLPTSAPGVADVCGTEALRVAVVERIRQKFGYSLQNEESVNSLVVKEMKDMLGRSLERLSKELYTKVTHFVLELIQNADDNDYPKMVSGQTKKKKSMDIPSVVFLVEKDRITLYNNEVGFSQTHIEALCDVGKSTKGKHKQGYIGQKGIGFKSVFKVTNCPEVHSNDYHIKFDAASDPVGLVLPHWIPKDDRSTNHDALTTSVNLDNERWATKIVLPLKGTSDLDKDQSRSLTASFQDIQPTLLLFLHRLKKITVINEVTSKTSEMSRRDVSDNVVEITNSKSKERWLVVRKQLKVSEKFSQQYQNVECTELALGFPLNNNSHLNKQEVFAYLPLRCFGFNFIVQGDFEIPSSRQDVDHDSAWNQWLRSEIPSLFVESMESFKEHKDYKDKLKAIQAFLKFVPTKGEIVDFFEPVAAKILSLLAGKACLPVEGDDGEITGWKQPSETVICFQDTTRKVITPQLLQRHLGLYFLHKKLVPPSSDIALLRSLGVKELAASDVVEVLKAVHDQHKEDGLSIKETALWFACLASYLDDEKCSDDKSSLLEEVRKLPLFHLNCGSVVNLVDHTVFFPLTGKQRKGQLQGRDDTLLQTDIKTIAKQLLSGNEDEVKNSKVKHLLESLGVRHISANDVIHQHIIPTFKDGTLWKTKSPRILVAYVSFIKNEWDVNKQAVNMHELKQIVQLYTHGGHFLNPEEKDINFPTCLNNLDLQAEFPGVQWILLDDCYLGGVVLAADKQKWRRFFEHLGVEDFLIIRKRKLQLSREELIQSQWSTAEQLLPGFHESFVVHDFYCPQLESLLSGALDERIQLNQMIKLFEILSKKWVNWFDTYSKAKLFDRDDNVLRDGLVSSFFSILKNSRWLPVISKSVQQNSNHRSREPTMVLLKPCDVYLFSERIFKVFANHAHYLKHQAALGDNRFAVALGVKITVTTEDFVSTIKDWATPKSEEEPLFFTTSLAHMKHVYHHIDRFLNEDEIEEVERMKLFYECPGIFVPTGKLPKDSRGGFDETVPVVGQFHSLDKLCWMDPTNLFVKYKPNIEDDSGTQFRRQIIRPFYESMKSLFRETLGVMDSPSFQEYAWLLVSVAAQTAVPDQNLIPDVYDLYQMLGSKCVAKPKDLDSMDDAKIVPLKNDVVTELKDILEDYPIFPSLFNCWVKISENPLLIDDPDMVELFRKGDAKMNKSLHFVNLAVVKSGHQDDPRKSIWLEIFYRALNIKKISECMEKEYIPVGIRPCSSVQKYMHDAVPFIQRYLKSYCPQAYEELIKRNMKSELTLLSFFQVTTLEVVYRLTHIDPPVVVTKDEPCYLDKPDNKYIFYIQKDHLEDFVEINRQIANLFLPNQMSFENFLLVLKSFLKENLMTEQQFCRQQKLLSINQDEEIWSVPKPYLEIPSRQVSTNANSPGSGLSAELNWTEEDEKMITSSKGSEDSGLKCWPPPPPSSSGRHGAPNTGHKEVNTEAQNVLPELLDRPKSHQEDVKRNHQMQPTERSHDQLSERRPCTDVNTPAGLPVTPKNQVASPAQPVNHVPQNNQQDCLTRQPSTDGATGSSPLTPLHHVSPPRLSNANEGSSPLTPPQRESPQRRAHKSGSDTVISANQMVPAQYAPEELITVEMIAHEDLTGHNPDEMRISLTENSGKSMVGRWGEAYVYDYLLKKNQESIEKNYLKVIWLNKEEETGSAHDLEIEFADKTPSILIEVKSTLSEDKEMFEISSREVIEANSVGTNYHVYRLYNAGQIYQSSVKLKILKDIPRMLDMKMIKLGIYL